MSLADTAPLLADTAGGLLPYIDDPDVLEIRCNSNGSAFVIRLASGKEAIPPVPAATVDSFLAALTNWVGGGGEWRASSPRLHAADPRLGLRVQAARPPVVEAPMLVLRKHPAHVFPLDDFVAKQILTPRQRDLLVQAVEQRQTIVISGSTGSAKTSLLNALLATLAESPDRIVIAEDDPELSSTARDVVFLRTSLTPLVTMRDLGKDLLRLSPDRIVIGEVRDGAMLDAVKAFYTGHAGLLSLHAESAASTLPRMEHLIEEVSATPQRRLLAEAIDVIVHMSKWGRWWKCTEMLAVVGLDGEQYVTQPLC